jgi:hypothetical protein
LKLAVMLLALSVVILRIQSSRKLAAVSQPVVIENASSSPSNSRRRHRTKADDVPSVSLLASSWGSLWTMSIFGSKTKALDSALRGGRVGSSLSSPSTPTGDDNYSHYNLHSHYPMVCNDEDIARNRDWRIHPSVPNYLDLIKNNREANAREHKQEFTVVGHFATGSSSKELNELARLQSCTYSLLNEWNQLAQRHSIQPWAAHGGSAIGARCFGSMNPWDDDIDISIWDCTALDRLWANGRLVNETYPDLNPEEYRVDKPHQSFEPRLIENDLILLKGGASLIGNTLIVMQCLHN